MSESPSSPVLPPVPDSTGHPRPPAAPRVFGSWTGRRQATSRHYRPDEGRTWLGNHEFTTAIIEAELRDAHPMLEEAIGPAPTFARRLATATAFAGFAIGEIVVIGGGYLLLSGGVDEIVRRGEALGWYIAVMFVLVFVPWLLFGRLYLRIRVSAHIVNAGGANNLWLYELARVTVRRRLHGPELRLEGRFASKTWPMSLPLGLLETNQRLWDLVYNGIRHSVATGATVDERTRQLLRLPH